MYLRLQHGIMVLQHPPAQPKEATMDLLNVGAVILFGMLVLGWLFQPAREQQIVIIHETPHELSITHKLWNKM